MPSASYPIIKNAYKPAMPSASDPIIKNAYKPVMPSASDPIIRNDPMHSASYQINIMSVAGENEHLLTDREAITGL